MNLHMPFPQSSHAHRALALSCALISAALAFAPCAHAQFERGPFPAPGDPALLVTGSPGNFVSVNLNAQLGPIGTFERATISAFWEPAANNPGGLNAQWQSDARAALISAPFNAPPPITGRTIYFGGPSGQRPTIAQNAALPGTIAWNTVPLDTPFVANGASTLFLAVRSAFASGGDSRWSSITVTLLGPLPPLTCPRTETEPNDTKAQSNVITSAIDDSICGVSRGGDPSGTDFSTDIIKVTTPAHTGVRRHQARIFSNTLAPPMTLLGRSQAGGVPTSDTVSIQPALEQPDGNVVTWYTAGFDPSPDARSVFIGVAGTDLASGQYKVQIIGNDSVQPASIARTLRPGAITISTAGTTGVDTDLWIMDSTFALIPAWGNDDRPQAADLQSTLTRTFAPGTYYLALGLFQTAFSEPSPSDDRFRDGALTDFPGALICGTPDTQSRNFTITDQTGSLLVATASTLPHEILFFKLVVSDGVPPVARCNAADVANDSGQIINNPIVPADPQIPNNGTTEADYNVFFTGFFDAQAWADIADDSGLPLPPFGSGGLAPHVNNGVTEADYNVFFSIFFDGCAL